MRHDVDWVQRTYVRYSLLQPIVGRFIQSEWNQFVCMKMMKKMMKKMKSLSTPA